MRTTLWLSLVLFSMSGLATASAQEIDVGRYRPPFDRHGFLTFDSTRVPGPARYNAGLAVQYARRSVSADASEAVALDHQVRADLYVQVGLGSRVAVGVDLPFVLYQRGRVTRGDDGDDELAARAVGDPRLALRVRLFGEQELEGSTRGLGLALEGAATLPVGADQSLAAERGPTFDFGVVLDFHVLSGLGAGLRIGYRHRAEAVIHIEEEFRDELDLDVGVKIPIPIAADFFGQFGFSLATQARRPFRDGTQNHAEGFLGLTYFVGDLAITGAGSVGIGRGFGTPAFRAVVVLDWSPQRQDADEDGITDDEDQCIHLPEDFDGFQDDDGCADPDNDLDGVLDAEDGCPLESVTPASDPDEDGCIG